MDQTQDILSRIIIRALEKNDLPALEWDGAYTHYRKLYQIAYERSRTLKGLAWIVELPDIGMVGQVFFQLICSRPELADGLTRAYLYSFRIKPAYRRMGIGSALLKFCEADLIERHVRYITLNVARDNKSAIKLYQQNGYKIVAPEPGLWQYEDHMGVWHQVIEPAWRMEKQLLP
jgi:ribosomal protein S18 acetylase RimI-like enzyme